MAAVNTRRVALGVFAGGVVWSIWSLVVNGVILSARYLWAQNAGMLLKQPRYPLFLAYWIVTLFVLTYILTWIYVSARGTLGPGPLTALRIGFMAGFLAGFPISLSLAAWAPFGRAIPFWWMLDLW